MVKYLQGEGKWMVAVWIIINTQRPCYGKRQRVDVNLLKEKRNETTQMKTTSSSGVEKHTVDGEYYEQILLKRATVRGDCEYFHFR